MSTIWLKDEVCACCGAHEVVECTGCQWAMCDNCGAGDTSCDCDTKESK